MVWHWRDLSRCGWREQDSACCSRRFSLHTPFYFSVLAPTLRHLFTFKSSQKQFAAWRAGLDLIWKKREGLKAKTKPLSSPQNISYPRTQTQQQHIQETGLAVSQTLYVSNPSTAIFKSGPKSSSDIVSTRFPKLLRHQLFRAWP